MSFLMYGRDIKVWRETERFTNITRQTDILRCLLSMRRAGCQMYWLEFRGVKNKRDERSVESVLLWFGRGMTDEGGE